MEKLEADLSYEDIRFFRSVARAQVKKDTEMKKKLQEEQSKKHGQQKSSGWLSWAWGGGGASSAQNDNDDPDQITITDADKKQINEMIDYDAAVITPTSSLQKDILLMRVSATLNRGSLALRTDPHGKNRDVLALVFDSLSADVSQMPESLDATISLGDFSVSDGTTPNTIHPKIVRVKENAAIEAASAAGSGSGDEVDTSNPFFTMRYEKNPLDGRADNAVAVKMRHLEIIYSRGYVEAIQRFFKPPGSQLESISALIVGAISLLGYLLR